MRNTWIRWVKGLPDKPQVFRITVLHGVPSELVVCRLMALWVWADTHAKPSERTAEGVTVAGLSAADATHFIDQLSGLPDLASALTAVGWLRLGSDRVELANIGRFRPTRTGR